MFKLLVVTLSLFATAFSAELPSRKYLTWPRSRPWSLGPRTEAKKRNVEVTICIVDDSGNLLFLQKAGCCLAEHHHLGTQKGAARAFSRAPSKDAADGVKRANVEVLAFPDFFPNQGGLPIQVDGKTIGGIAASGAKSEIDEAIAQAGLDALFKK